MLYLEVTTERCSLKYVFFKTRETRHLTHLNDREGQHHHLSDVKSLLITCIRKITFMLLAYNIK